MILAIYIKSRYVIGGPNHLHNLSHYISDNGRNITRAMQNYVGDFLPAEGLVVFKVLSECLEKEPELSEFDEVVAMLRLSRRRLLCVME